MINEELNNLIELAQGNRTQNQYALNSGVNSSFITKIIKGERKPSPVILKKLANRAYNGITYEMFMRAAGYLDADVKISKSKGIKIPVLGVIPAGVPIEAIEEILDYEEITEDLARTGDFFALRVSGDSMAPQILENDIVIIKKQEDCENNDICAVIVNGYNATLKRIKKDTNGIMLVPYNQAYEPTYYSKEQVLSLPVKIIGKAIEIRRGL